MSSVKPFGILVEAQGEGTARSGDPVIGKPKTSPQIHADDAGQGNPTSHRGGAETRRKAKRCGVKWGKRVDNPGVRWGDLGCEWGGMG